MYAVTMIFSFILATGMFTMYIARKIVESPTPPKEITPDMIHDMEILVNAYYGGTTSTRFYLAILTGGFIIAEIVHNMLNLGRV